MSNSNEVHWLVSLVVAFLPFFMFCVIGFWHGRQIRKSLMTADGRSLAQVFDELTKELKRLNDNQRR